MTKAQAAAASAALESALMPHSIVLTYPTAGVELWTIELSPTITYTGTQLAAIANYCAAHALTLTMIVQELGIA